MVECLPNFEKKNEKLPARYATLLTSVILVFLMTGIVTFLGTARNLGFERNFLQLWIETWLFAYVVALPVFLLLMPLVRKLVSEIVDKNE